MSRAVRNPGAVVLPQPRALAPVVGYPNAPKPPEPPAPTAEQKEASHAKTADLTRRAAAQDAERKAASKRKTEVRKLEAAGQLRRIVSFDSAVQQKFPLPAMPEGNLFADFEGYAASLVAAAPDPEAAGALVDAALAQVKEAIDALRSDIQRAQVAAYVADENKRREDEALQAATDRKRVAELRTLAEQEQRRLADLADAKSRGLL
jgi:hypothetical protein